MGASPGYSGIQRYPNPKMVSFSRPWKFREKLCHVHMSGAYTQLNVYIACLYPPPPYTHTHAYQKGPDMKQDLPQWFTCRGLNEEVRTELMVQAEHGEVLRLVTRGSSSIPKADGTGGKRA